MYTMDNCMIKYNITEDDLFKKINAASLTEMTDSLRKAGFHLLVEDGHLTLIKNTDKYLRTQNRKAGRKRKLAQKDGETYEVYHFADIVCMMQSLKDKEIAEKINMPIATYYRHKKRLTSSAYYTALDQNKLDDMQYLQSVSGNLLF